MKVMVPLDFSETSLTALNTGITIANKLKADLRIVHVKPTSNYAAGYEGGMQSRADVEAILDKILLEHRQAYYVNRGTFDYKIREGNVCTELANQSKYDDATLIVMGSHGVSGITKSWIGGNAYRMICNAPCPVLVIRPDMTFDANFKRIAIPLEMKKSSRFKIPIVAGVAKMFDAKAVLLGVRRSGIQFIFNRLTLNIKQVENFLTGSGIEVERSIMLDEKDSDQKFIDAIESCNADLVAIDVTNSGSFITDRFRSSLIKLVNNSHCPVLAIPVKE